MRSLFLLPFLAASLAAVVPAQPGKLPPEVKDTQDPKDVPPSPDEAVRRFRPGQGFRVTLFAGEPNVAQPIAMAFDDRGRLWVAECFSYPRWQDPPKGHDRILIFEDTDGDGRFDRRTIFWDKAYNLTGLVLGDGGVYALCAPHLLFIPIKADGDTPAGPPRVILDGWSLKAGHNIVNGLIWGPDGWLYGRHGILAESQVGPPGTPALKRTRINCGIWRYHPEWKTFEVVAHGTTNPWGLDFDDHGEAFFTNSVIGHLWHAVPGARFERMYGLDYNPFSYELIPSTSDHLHWGGGHWTSSRGGQGIHDDAGGGHAHAGAMVYLGDNWPDSFRNNIFMCNIHGNRVNRNLLVRKGNSYVGKRAADLIRADNPWFRGIAIDYGPDGGVFVTDWCDLGECHDYDGVHRTSGRIYKIAHGQPRPPAALDLARLGDADLVRLQLSKNDWHVRHARRLLAERARAGKPMAKVHQALKAMFDGNPDVTRKLRALWALYGTGGTTEAWLRNQVHHADEHVRSWAVRLLCDRRQPSREVQDDFLALAEKDRSALVRLYLAAMLQRLPLADRLELAAKLAGHAEDGADRCQPLLIWYGIEPAVAADKAAALRLASVARMSKLRRFIARRLTEAVGDGKAALEPLVAALGKEKDPAVQRDLLEGMRDGLKGRKNFPMPKEWVTTYPQLAHSLFVEVGEASHLLGLVFDDPRALDHLRKVVVDSSAPVVQRGAALHALVGRGTPGLVPVLFKLLDEAPMRGPALRALAAYDDDGVPATILRRYPSLAAAEKQDALATLASRPRYALALLEALDKKRLPRSDVSAFTARQLQDLRDKKVTDRLAQVWGQIRPSPAQKKALIAKYKGLLTAEAMAKADRGKGRLVFNRTCFQCHMLFGEGNKIGPDLTGSNRGDLHYLLENIIDPSAVIGKDYQLTNIVTSNGRFIAGIIVEETERALTVQTATEKLVLSKSDVEERRVMPVSMMPEGQIDQLTFTELRDLIAYLGSKEQVPLP
jgi:putative membrane-bound dehydrogenase-like protein